jgi:hypothetical protein
VPRSAFACLEDADTASRKVIETHASVITPAALTELDVAATSIAAALAELSVGGRRPPAADAVEDAYRRVVDVRKLATGPGLQADLRGVLGALEEASDDLDRPLYLPDE